MNESVETLTLNFRGARTYLHGTDIHAALTSEVLGQGAAGVLEMHFHSLLRLQPDLVLSTERRLDLRESVAFRGEAVVGNAEEKIFVTILESDRPVNERKTCNERDVAALGEIDLGTKSIRLSQVSCGSAIETIVFFNKALHAALLPDVKGSWLFARLVLTRPLPSSPLEDLRLEMKQVLGDKFTKTLITISGESVGHICFSQPA
jgi:hypothetical protein